MNKLLLDLNLTNMNKKQNQQSISQSNSYSRTFIQPASFISKDKVVKPRYIHKEKTPTNRIQILHDESPLAYEYDNNK